MHQLPPYSPELNPSERLWQHTRKNGTHNRFFGGLDVLLATLTRIFGEMQSPPPTNPVLSDAFLSIVMSLYFYAVVLARFEEFALSFRRGIEHGLERTMSSQDTLRFR